MNDIAVYINPIIETISSKIKSEHNIDVKILYHRNSHDIYLLYITQPIVISKNDLYKICRKVNDITVYENNREYYSGHEVYKPTYVMEINISNLIKQDIKRMKPTKRIWFTGVMFISFFGFTIWYLNKLF